VITEFIIQAALAPVVFLLNLMPTFTLPSWLTNSTQLENLAGTLGGYLAQGDYWLPIHETVAVMPLLAAAVVAYYVWAGVRFAIRLVRG
jgi:hypothetical protein